MKTAAREMVMDTMVKLISLALLIVASSAFSPRSIRRTVFSRNTMASSTRKPMAKVRAMSDRLSKLYPSNSIAMNVMSSESGRAIAGIKVSFARPRNMKITNTTSTKAMPQGHLHVDYGVNNGLRTVIDRREPHRSGQFCADHRQQVSDALGNFHGVGTGLAIDRDDDGGQWRRIAAHPKPHIDPLVLNRIYHPSDIAQIDRRAVLGADD